MRKTFSIRKSEQISSLFINISAKSQTTFAQIMSQSDLNKIDDDSREFPIYNYPLKFEVIKECNVTKARCSRLTLPHATLETPQFMPVGTQGALKGILPQQIKDLNCNLILANTYHLGHRPVGKLFKLSSQENRIGIIFLRLNSICYDIQVWFGVNLVYAF